MPWTFFSGIQALTLGVQIDVRAQKVIGPGTKRLSVEICLDSRCMASMKMDQDGVPFRES